MHELTCPLCSANHVSPLHEDRVRKYCCCNICQLIFVPSKYHLSAVDEKAVYDQHENSPSDPQYRAFLNRLFLPVHTRLAPNRSGLDFGSGPGPTLSLMFEEAGHKMAIYDPFYSSETLPLEVDYDFITSSEVFEHFHSPKREIQRLWQCLRPNGLLGIMTNLVTTQATFATWYYKNDPTHVSFYSHDTFAWLATHLNADLEFVGNDVILLRKK